MKNKNTLLAILVLLFVVLMSIPYLVPHTGLLALFGLVPLLCMERIATMTGTRRIWLWHYSAFVLWNAATTFWVCNATIGGGIFAVLANAFQMSIVFGLFRWSRKILKGSLPYILLAMMWIAWEKYYLTVAQISWPWLVLGNAFARTLSMAQWYEYLGTLGGSLWIWACNLGLFGIMVSLSDGSWSMFNAKAKTAAIGGYLLLLAAPIALSMHIYNSYDEVADKTIDVVVLQPNIDPYQKFQALSQDQQDAILAGQLTEALTKTDTGRMVLAVAPETFTSHVCLNNLSFSRTLRRFENIIEKRPDASLLMGASTYDLIESETVPSHTARKVSDGMWIETHNSALMLTGNRPEQIYHKSKLVVAVEMTPYPAFFCKIDDLLGGVMGRNVGQDEVTLLNCEKRDSAGNVNASVPVGCAVCYESVYPEHFAEYVRKGAELMTVITNDAWWGDTPGYRQHLSYSSLRAIETRRDIARSANTGISALINQRGDIVAETEWWKPAVLTGKVCLNDRQTFFVRQGDIVGRLCVFFSVLLLLGVAVRIKVRK